MKLDPTLQVAALAAAELAINQALRLDPLTCKALAELDDRIFAIRISDLDLELFIQIRASGIVLLSHFDGQVTTRISGPIKAYSQVLTSEDKASALINSELKLKGNSAPLIRLQEILADLDLDWEAHMAALIGDVPAHLLGQTARQLSKLGSRVRQAFLRHLEEYIHEEGRLSPGQLEVEQFYRDIHRLNVDTDRVAARIDKLKARIASRSAQKPAPDNSHDQH